MNRPGRKMQIYHNPRCSKSRQTLALLETHGHQPEIIDYLQHPPDAETLLQLSEKLGLPLREFMRRNEPEYREQRELLETMSDAEQCAWLAEHPRVLQRPIVVAGDQARLGRPPENVLEIL
jgi:arsenate reductase